MTMVVLLHGLGSSSRSWQRVRPLLDEVAVVTPDLPGGSIEHKATAALGALRDAGGAPPEGVVAVGHSMGGLVATAMAEQGGGLVRGLVLVNSPPTVESRLSRTSRIEQAIRNPVAGRILWRLAGDDRRREGMRSAFAPGADVPAVFVEDLARTPWDVFRSSTIAIDEYLGARTLHQRAADAGVPVHVVFGERDGRVDSSSLAGYDGVARVTVTRIPEAGHTPIWETPERVAEAIHDALR
jgi:pimeloyl-ACP methyl ester carboxylesterase